MTLTLTANIDADARYLTVTGTVPDDIEPTYQFRLGNELLELQAFVVRTREVGRAGTFTDRNEWYVLRGLDTTTAASHTAGDEVKGATDAYAAATSGTTPPSPFSSGGGGGLPDGGTTGQALVKASDADQDVEWASGSGSGSVRWLGPCKIGAFDGQAISSPQGFTGGTYTLTVNGETTAELDWDASQAEFTAALEALPSIGAGNVTVVFAGSSLADGDVYLIQFHELLATDLLTCDASALTGPDSPYTITPAGVGAWLVEMFTPAVGDIIEDFLHSVPVAFDGEDASLYYTDDDGTTGDFQVAGPPPAWSMPIAAQGIDGLSLSIQDEFTNFTGNGDGGDPGDARSRPTALSALIAQWAASASATSVNLYQNLPAVVKNAVPIYSYVKDVDTAPTQGQVWIWVKVSTPAPLMD